MIPVLWLCGPPGVGKTAVGWEIYQRLQRAGAEPAYVDVDQLGMCFPALAEDPDRHALKARNVAALRANFAAAGARALIVSGVVDAGRGPDVDVLGPHVVVVRLRAETDDLRARLTRRGVAAAQHEAVLDEAGALDRSTFADWSIDTSLSSIDDVVARVLGDLGDWPPAERSEAPTSAESQDAEVGGEMLWVAGPTGVGKSTIGFRAYLDVLRTGRQAAYIDVDQIGFCSTAPNDPALRARNLAALWRNFHDAGARLAIVTGPVSTRSETLLYEEALAGVNLSWRRLRAGDAELTRRILTRAGGGSWPQPGDPLRGRPREDLLAVAERAIVAGGQQDQPGLPVDVDGLGVAEAAAALLASWPAGGR